MEKLGSVKFHILGRGEGLSNLSREFKFGENRTKITESFSENLHTLMTTLVSNIITVTGDNNR